MRIGIDVGGTNTDAALMNGTELIASCKSPTTANVSDGIRSAIGEVLRSSGVAAADIRCVMIGTTHFTNAFVEGRISWTWASSASRYPQRGEYRR